MNVHYDQKTGIGAVPHNQDIQYFGFKCWMTPDMFLRLAKKIYIDPQDTRFLSLQNLIKHGKPIGSPFLECEWDIAKKVWTVWDHEGRHRVEAIKNLWPNESIEVHIFPGSGIRAKDISPEMLQSFMTGVFAQDKTYVQKPTAQIECQGKDVTPQAAQTTPPPVFETQYQKSRKEIEKFEKVGPQVRKMQEYFGVVKKNNLTGKTTWIRENVQKPPIEKRLSNAHDKLYQKFQKILDKEKPCQFGPNGSCAGTRANNNRGYYSQPKVACCAGCDHHDPEKGCTVQSLGCKGWRCPSMQQNFSSEADALWKKLQIKAHRSGMSGVRNTKEEEIKKALNVIKYRIWRKKRDKWIAAWLKRHIGKDQHDAWNAFYDKTKQLSTLV